MKLELTSFDLYWLGKELKVLEGGRVNKVYSPAKGEYLFLIWVPRTGRRYLRFVLPSIVFFDDEKGEQELRPSAFVMFLRKHLLNHAVRSVSQVAFERILKITFEKEKKKTLVFELFAKGNIILLDEDDRVISALERQDFKDRSVTKGMLYNPPVREYNAPTISISDFESALKKTKQESLVKFLAIDLGLGGMYAEEVCARGKQDKNSLPDNPQKVFNALKSLFDGESKPAIYEKDEKPITISPVELESINAQKNIQDSFNQAIRKSLGKAAKHKATAKGKAALDKKIQKTAHALEKQTEALKKLQATANENQRKGETIYEKYNQVNNILEQIKTARLKHSWKEIKEKLKGHDIVKEINEKTGTISIELD